MYTNFRLTKSYRRAAACTPFRHVPFLTNITYKSDTDDGKLYHGFRATNPAMFGKPVLVILPHYPHPKTGLPCLRWAVRILDRNAQELWTGLFDPKTETWDMWELKLFHKTWLQAGVGGHKLHKFAHRSCASNLRARIDSNGRGSSVIHLQHNHVIGYDGVDHNGYLRYALLMHGGLNQRVTRPTMVMQRWGVVPESGVRSALWYQNFPYPAPAPDPLTWTWTNAVQDTDDLYTQRMHAVRNGAHTGVMLMWGAEVAEHHMLPRFAASRGMRANHMTTPWEEAEYLVGRQEKAVNVTKARAKDIEVLFDKMNHVTRVIRSANKRPSGAMLGMIKRLLSTVDDATVEQLERQYCRGAGYVEVLAKYINAELADRGKRLSVKHDYAPDSLAAQILGGLS